MQKARIACILLAGAFPGFVASAKPLACFAVSHMYETDEHRYFVDAMSHCGSEMEVVYVRIAFLTEKGLEMARSFWSLRLVRPEKRERHEFAYPIRAEGFARIKVLDVVTTLEEAMR
jgi:hypothetical protein